MQQLLLILFSVLFIIMQKQIIIRIQNGLFFVLKSKDFGTFNLLFTCSLVLCSNRMQRICLLVKHLQMSLGSSQMLIRCAPYSSVPLTTYCLTCSYGLSWFKLPLISYTVRTASCCQTLKIIITMIKCDFSRTSAVSFIQLSVFIFNDKDLIQKLCKCIFIQSHTPKTSQLFHFAAHCSCAYQKQYQQ